MVFNNLSSKASMVLVGERTPKKRGILPGITGGAGVDITLKAIDNLVGSPLQRFAGFNLPFLGNVGVIDAINFLIFSGGGRNLKGGIIAVGGAKLVTGALPFASGIGLSQGGVTAASPIGLGAPQ